MNLLITKLVKQRESNVTYQISDVTYESPNSKVSQTDRI